MKSLRHQIEHRDPLYKGMERNFARLYSSPACVALNKHPINPDEIAHAIYPHPDSFPTMDGLL